MRSKTTMTTTAMSRGCVLTLFWLLCCVGLAAAQCSYYQKLEAHNTYYIFNRDYPNNYQPGLDDDCTWTMEADERSTIHLDCSLSMDASPGCSADHLVVWLRSDAIAHHYCGDGNFAEDSVINKMVVRLASTNGTGANGGKFLCEVTSSTPMHCECGSRLLPRIVGGSETGINEFPMMAGLVDVHHAKVFCGGTIVSDKFVITAAHCVVQREVATVAVVVGEHDVTTGSETDSTDLIRLMGVVAHPQFDFSSQANDIALVRLSKAARFSDKVGPACLPFRFQGQSIEGLDLIVLGWGATEFEGPMSDRLKQTQLRVLDNAECHAAHPNEVITDAQLCTHAVDTNACQSDSGGPLLWHDPTTGRLFLVGVVSYGIGCATTSPGVNTRVDAYLDWIEQETQASFCVK